MKRNAIVKKCLAVAVMYFIFAGMNKASAQYVINIGNDASHPYFLGSVYPGNIITDYFNNDASVQSDFTVPFGYYGFTSPAKYYIFTVQQAGKIIISNKSVSPAHFRTLIVLYSKIYNPVTNTDIPNILAYNNQFDTIRNSHLNLTDTTHQGANTYTTATIIKYLPAGTYYLASLANGSDLGNIQTTVKQDTTGYGGIAGTSMAHPYDLGLVGSGGTSYMFGYTHDNYSSEGFRNYIGDPSNELYFKFKIDTDKNVKIYGFDPVYSEYETNMYLLDSLGNQLYFNNGNSSVFNEKHYPYNGNSTGLDVNLHKGTYFIAQELKQDTLINTGDSIILRTNIEVNNMPPPPTGYAVAPVFPATPIGNYSINNYIIANTMRRQGITASTNPATLAADDLEQTITYYDGLGSPLQEVNTKASPNYRDIIVPMEYDQYGRESKKYLPYIDTVANNNGAYKATAIADQALFYADPGSRNAPGVDSTSKPYSQTIYEPSPLNRAVEQGAPGLAWQPTLTGGAGSANHTVRMVYTTNDKTSTFSSTPVTNNPGSKVVALYTTLINPTSGTQRLVRTANSYDAGQLQINITRDENWQPADGCIGITEEYKDKKDHIVLKRNYNLKTGAVEILSTYYVYDDFGNLAFVLPPLANADNSGTPSKIVIDSLCYQYQYDGRNRMVAKKVPGKGWDYIIYNKLDQVIATQDPVQRSLSPQQASFTKYDALGRVIMSGYYQLTDTGRVAMQAAANAQTTLWEKRITSGLSAGYSNVTIPTSRTILIANYYDNYDSIPGLPSIYNHVADYSQMTNDLLTVKKVAVLNTPGDVLWTVNYYDDLGRVVQTYKQHYLKGHPNYSSNNYDAITTAYNFTNQVDTVIRRHYTADNTSAPAITIGNTYIYDHMGRKRNTGEQIYGSDGVGQTPVYLSLLDYNEIGQLTAKHYHLQPGMSTYLGESGYSYNERGWLTAITPLGSSEYYSEVISYDKPVAGTGVTPQFNGNISQFSYNSPHMNAHYLVSPDNFNTVNYTYDALNRLLKSKSTLGVSDEAIEYDKAGNITSLSRTQGATLTSLTTSNLTYAYYTSSNKLHTVTADDGSVNNNYNYDGNGNAIQNTPTKRLTYNLLNLPLVYKNGSTTLCTYYYDAEGNKLRNVSNPTTGSGSWDYIDGIVYNDRGPGGVTALAFIQTEEGKASSPDNTTYTYTYNIKDYLGNVRASFDRGPDGLPRGVQEDDYYAFGLDRKYYDASNGNRYLYNGKEIQTDLANQYDYGARFYDPVIGRWTTVDPLADKFDRSSPYNYGFDNPIRFVDPDGMGPDDDAPTQYGSPLPATGAISSSYDLNEKFKNAPQAQSSNTSGIGDPYRAVGRKALMGDKEGFTKEEILKSGGLYYGGDYSGSFIDNLNYYLFKFNTTLNPITWIANAYYGYTANTDFMGNYQGPVATNVGFALALIPMGGEIKGISTLFGEDTYSVYHGLDEARNVKYVGITKRNPAVRFGEHTASGTARATLDYEVVHGATGLSRTQARIWEQSLINQHGLENLLNLRNSIAPQYWYLFGIK